MNQNINPADSADNESPYGAQSQLAKRIACQAHQNQTDKAGQPYIHHPEFVASLLEDDEEKAAAWLHDVLEDSSITEEQLKQEGINETVIDMLRLLRHDENTDYFEYIENLKRHPGAVRVKLADLTHNMDYSRWNEVNEQNLARLEKYKKAREILLDGSEDPFQQLLCGYCPKPQDENKVIGIVGLGIMGASMARNLMKKGWQVHSWARHPQKAAKLLKEGLILHPTIEEMAKHTDKVFTIVSEPGDVREVWLGKDGLLNTLKKGSIAVDMTTSSVDLAKELYHAGREKGIQVLDAPVTGGDAGAKAGTLTILAAGDKDAFDSITPAFEAVGTHLCYQGEAGKGQAAKMINQILIAGAMAGLAEAWNTARALDLDVHLLYESLHEGAAASKSLDLYWPRLEKDDMEPGFCIRHFIKDLNLANDLAKGASLDLPMTEMVLSQYQSLNAPDKGTQALADWYNPEEN